MSIHIRHQAKQLARLKYEQDILYDQYAKTFGLQRTSFFILIWLYYAQSPLSQACLSHKLGASKQLINTSIKLFEEEKLISFVPNERDKRQKFIYLTDKGKAYASSILDPLEEAEGRAIAQMSEEERDKLLQLYASFNESLEQQLESQVCHD
ncbi:MarR family winged helix-turn-helix transcriptional regulator [Streptococcus cuniculi]|uniref:MarR family transcriptional regulator n=1 Tax=Streptococcus cuniculi TaxID=1432788 RepID=A0A4Y9J9G5_9STRE|nr:MarR family transcriptional regulator [Streptococcus cuniculi]MBF0778380.1 MarR family transcriptional regulator [Streptococcus cuniculi]TFU97663.1 MarR family transcriptional regulator [Streptococcus cuniculi]